MSGDILVGREGDIATVTLSNPERLNALSLAMWRRLGEVATELDADESLRCIVIRGAAEVYGLQAHPGDGGGGSWGLGFEIARFTGSASEEGQGPRFLGYVAGEWSLGAELMGGVYSIGGAEYGIAAFALTVRWPGLAGIAIVPLAGSF